MPRVGSSKMIARGCIASHFASTTFCWLPPESEPTSVADARARGCRAAAARPRPAPLRRRAAPARLRRAPASCGSEMFSAIERSSTTPLRLAVLRHQVDAPRRSRRAASRSRPRAPSSRTVPPSSGSMPKTARASSVRPAPISPASPRISPRRTVEVDRPVRIGRGPQRRRSRGAARPAAPPAAGRSTSGRGRSSAGSSPPGEISPAAEPPDQPAVAQHHHPVGAGRHLVEPVRDEDDADARGLAGRRSP